MHQETIRAFGARLDRLVALMESPEHLEQVEQQRTERVTHDGVLLQFSSVTKPDFDDLLSKMRSERHWAARFSNRTLRGEVLSAVVARQNGCDSEEYVSQMAARLDAWHPRYRVWVPLSGVLLASDTDLDFGRVVLVQMAESLFKEEIASKLPATVTVVGAEDLFLYTVDVREDLIAKPSMQRT